MAGKRGAPKSTLQSVKGGNVKAASAAESARDLAGLKKKPPRPRSGRGR